MSAGCQGCGNDDAVYDREGRTAEDGATPELCLDCLEMEDDLEDGDPGTDVLAIDPATVDPIYLPRLGGLLQ